MLECEHKDLRNAILLTQYYQNINISFINITILIDVGVSCMHVHIGVLPLGVYGNNKTPPAFSRTAGNYSERHS